VFAALFGLACMITGCGGEALALSAIEDEIGGGGQSGEDRFIPQRQFQLGDLEKVTIEVGGEKFDTWVMDTLPKMQEGLMFVQDEDIDKDEAMIFVYPEPQPMSFWMRNTFIPLDIIYVSEDKKILNSYTMIPLDERPNQYPSQGSAKYAIEFEEGAIERLDLKPGMIVTIPDSVQYKGR
jgi:hypothetical protein